MSKEENIKKHINMYYDFDKEREVLSKIQKCQRNWDYDKFEIALPEYRNYVNELYILLKIHQVKQHEGYFDVYWTLIENLYKKCQDILGVILIEEIHHLIGETHKQTLVF